MPSEPMKILRVDNLKGVRIEGPDADGLYTITEYKDNSRDGYSEYVWKTKTPVTPKAMVDPL